MLQNTTNQLDISSNEKRVTPLVFARCSVPSERHPTWNEDRIVIDERRGLAAVFDGVGGSAAGEIASRTAAQAIRTGWKRAYQHLYTGNETSTLLEDCDPEMLKNLLLLLVEEADTQVRTDGAQKAGNRSLATTIALAILYRRTTSNDYILFFAHVGDSRVYLLKENEPLTSLTSDDGVLTILVLKEMLDPVDAQRIDQATSADELNDMELSFFHQRNGITQALGDLAVPIAHVSQATVHPGDRILLCTDGVHDNLTDVEMEHIVRTAARTTVARRLVEQALVRSREDSQVMIRAKPDDMSAVVITCRS